MSSSDDKAPTDQGQSPHATPATAEPTTSNWPVKEVTAFSKRSVSKVKTTLLGLWKCLKGSLKGAWDAIKEPVESQGDAGSTLTPEDCQAKLLAYREELLRYKRNVAPWYPRFLLTIAVLVATATPIFIVVRDLAQKSLTTSDFSSSQIVLLLACVVTWLGTVTAAFWNTRTLR